MKNHHLSSFWPENQYSPSPLSASLGCYKPGIDILFNTDCLHVPARQFPGGIWSGRTTNRPIKIARRFQQNVIVFREKKCTFLVSIENQCKTPYFLRRRPFRKYRLWGAAGKILRVVRDALRPNPAGKLSKESQ